MSVFRIDKSPDEERSDKSLRDKLENHAITPPSYIWDNVEENLPQERNRRGFIFWLMPLAACLAGLAGLLYMLLPQNTSQVAQKNTETVISSQPNKNSLHTETNENQPATAYISPEENVKSKAEEDTYTSTGSQNSNIAGNKKDIAVRQEHSENSASYHGGNRNKVANKLSPEKGVFADGKPVTFNSNTKPEDKFATESIIKENEHSLAENTSPENVSTKTQDSLTKEKTVLAASEKPAEKDLNLLTEKKEKTTKKSGRSSKWAIGANIGVGRSYRLINNGFGISMDKMADTGRLTPMASMPTNYNNVEMPGTSWSGGLNVKYNLNDNWSLMSGFNVLKTNIRSKINTVIYVSGGVPNIGSTLWDTTYIQKNSTGEFDYAQIESLSLNQENANPGEPRSLLSSVSSHEAKINYTFSFVDVPLEIQYRISARKAAWFIQGGPSLRFLTGSKAVYSAGSNTASINLIQPYNSLAVSANIASGISIPVKKFDVQIGPSFSMWLTPLMKTKPKTHLYAAQVKGAIYYNF